MDNKHFLGKKVVICGLLRHKESQVAYLEERIKQSTS